MRTPSYPWRRILAVAALCGALALAQPVDIASRPLQYERSHDYDVQHYRIQLTLDDTQRSFAGETTIPLTALRDGFQQLALDAETFTVDRVRDANGTPLTLQHSNGKLFITLAVSRSYGETIEVRIRYHAEGVHPDPGKFGMSRG